MKGLCNGSTWWAKQLIKFFYHGFDQELNIGEGVKQLRLFENPS